MQNDSCSYRYQKQNCIRGQTDHSLRSVRLSKTVNEVMHLSLYIITTTKPCNWFNIPDHASPVAARKLNLRSSQHFKTKAYKNFNFSPHLCSDSPPKQFKYGREYIQHNSPTQFTHTIQTLNPAFSNNHHFGSSAMPQFFQHKTADIPQIRFNFSRHTFQHKRQTYRCKIFKIFQQLNHRFTPPFPELSHHFQSANNTASTRYTPQQKPGTSARLRYINFA